jgi:hypothetical protein
METLLFIDQPFKCAGGDAPNETPSGHEIDIGGTTVVGNAAVTPSSGTLQISAI